MTRTNTLAYSTSRQCRRKKSFSWFHQTALRFHLLHAHLLGARLRDAGHLPPDLQGGPPAEGGDPAVVGAEPAAPHRGHGQHEVEVKDRVLKLLFLLRRRRGPLWRYDTQHNDTQRNDTQHGDTQLNDTQQ